jgi:hypothetical protein
VPAVVLDGSKSPARGQWRHDLLHLSVGTPRFHKYNPVQHLKNDNI